MTANEKIMTPDAAIGAVMAQVRAATHEPKTGGIILLSINAEHEFAMTWANVSDSEILTMMAAANEMLRQRYGTIPPTGEMH